MASRFVSAGAIDPNTGDAAAAQPSTTAPQADADRQQKEPNDEWLAVEKELAAERRRREEARSAAASSNQPSLFEVLQANKEAKQSAFDEANKIRNQFRALDDDEIDFLDEVKARQREDEARLRRETEAGLEAFRAAQRGGQVRTEDDVGEAERGDEWAASAGGRKRKREKERGKIGIVKKRTTSEAGKVVNGKSGAEKAEVKPQDRKTEEKVQAEPKADKPAPAAKPKMALVSYASSDEDD